jgi:hypothetical protein
LLALAIWKPEKQQYRETLAVTFQKIRQSHPNRLPCKASISGDGCQIVLPLSSVLRRSVRSRALISFSWATFRCQDTFSNQRRGKKQFSLKTKDINTPCSLTGTKVDAWTFTSQPKNPRPSHPHHSASPGLEAKDAKSAIAQGLRKATNQGRLPHASFTHHAQVHPRRVVLEHRGQHNTLPGRERGQSLLESAGPGTARATWALVNPGNMVKSSQMDGWFHFSGAQVFSKRVENSEVWCLQCNECCSECSFHSERIAKYDSMGRDLKNIGYTACM